MSIFSDLIAFVFAVLAQWKGIILGWGLITVATLLERWRGARRGDAQGGAQFPWKLYRTLLLAPLFLAFFLAWRDQHLEVRKLREGSAVSDLLELANRIDRFAQDRRTGTNVADTLRLYEQRFWTPVVLWRDRIGRECQQGDPVLSSQPRTIDEIERTAGALTALARCLR
jgi:hypothetical protein